MSTVERKLYNTMSKICNDYSVPVVDLVVTGRLKSCNGNFSYSYNRALLRTAKTPKEVVDALIKKKITISSDIFKLFSYEEGEKTLRHELAHYINFVYNKSGGHDTNFKDICIELGGTMNAKHAVGKYEDSLCTNWVSREVGYMYTCPCGKTKHKTIKKVSAKMMERYKCPHCKTYINKFKVEKRG
jgi:predicted SprT family Zn-dependent metalloprotease